MSPLEFKTHILPCYNMMYVVILRIVSSEQDAADIVQELIKRLWERHLTLTLPDIPRAFCATVARNAAINHMRTASRHPQASLDEVKTEYQLQPDDDSDRLAALEKAIDMLPENRQQVIRLSLQGMSGQQIALATSLSEANVRQLLSRARCQLKSIISTLL